MYMTANVLQETEDGFLVGNEATGEEYIVFWNDPGRFTTGDRIGVTYDGRMTKSYPPQLTAMSVTSLSPAYPGGGLGNLVSGLVSTSFEGMSDFGASPNFMSAPPRQDADAQQRPNMEQPQRPNMDQPQRPETNQQQRPHMNHSQRPETNQQQRPHMNRPQRPQANHPHRPPAYRPTPAPPVYRPAPPPPVYRPAPPAQMPLYSEFQGVVIQKGRNFLTITGAYDRRQYRVEYPYAHHFCLGQQVTVRYNGISWGNPAYVTATDIAPVCALMGGSG